MTAVLILAADFTRTSQQQLYGRLDVCTESCKKLLSCLAIIHAVISAESDCHEGLYLRIAVLQIHSLPGSSHSHNACLHPDTHAS